MKLLVPADSASAEAAVDIALDTKGPVYTRLMRDPLFELYSKDEKFELGKAKIIKEGKSLTVLTYGDLVFESLKAADKLESEGISIEVIDAFSIKPFDYETLFKSVLKTKKLIVVENHQIRNGLGYDIAANLLQNVIFTDFAILGLKDTFAETGNYYKIIDKYGFSENKICSKVREMVSGK